MSDPRVKQIKQALISNQSGRGINDIRVYMGLCRHYCQGFKDVIHNEIRIVAPVRMRAVKTLCKTSSKSVKTIAKLVTNSNQP